MTTFITGDRTPGPLYVPLVAVELLRAVAQGEAVQTGENGGVEEIVRELGSLAGIEVSVVPGTKAEFNTRHDTVASSGARAVAIHTEPHSSSLIPSLLQSFSNAGRSDDAVRIVTHADLMVS